MLLTEKYCVHITLLVLLLFGAGQGFAQPLLLNKIVSVSVNNIPVSSVLLKLSAETGIRFSYDPSQISASRKVTLTITGQKVETVLRTLFNDPELQYREVGGQVVIFKPKFTAEPEPPAEPDKTIRDQQDLKTKTSQEENTSKSSRDTIYIPIHDTIRIRKTDTLVLTQTLYLRDTLRIHDTVFIEKSQPSPAIEKISILDKILGNAKDQPGTGWYGGISFALLPGTARYLAVKDESAALTDHMKMASRFSPSNFSAGVFSGYRFPLLSIESGLAYSRFGERFEYSFTSLTGGFYKTDTVESYYTLAGADTSWFYVTDSSWVNIDYKNWSFKNQNTFRYFELPLTFKYHLVSENRIDVYVLAGVIAGYRVGQKALVIKNDANFSVEWVEKSDLKPLLFSWQAGSGASVPLGKNWRWFAECSYRSQFGSQLKEEQVRKYFNFANIKTGIFVKL